MHYIDIRTLIFLAMASSLLLAIAMQLANRITRDNPAVWAWAWGAALGAVGLSLVGLRSVLPDLLSIVLANTLIAAGMAWIYLGLRLCLGLPRGTRWDIHAGLVVAAASLYYTYAEPNLAARIIIVSAVLAGLDLLAVRLLLASGSARNDIDRGTLFVVGLSYLAGGLVFALRAVLTSYYPLDQDFMTASDAIHKLAFATIIAQNIVLTLGLTFVVASRTDRGLRASRERFRGLVEQAVDGIFVGDVQGDFIDINTAGARMLGYAQEEIIGLNIRDVIAEEEIPRIPDEMAKYAGSLVTRGEWRFKRKDGSFFFGEVVGRQLNDGRMQSIVRDITERKRAEEAILVLNQTLEQRVEERTWELRERERVFQSLADNIPDNIMRYDCDSRVLYVNRSLERALGRSASELLGRMPHEFEPDGRYDAVEKAVRWVGATGESVELDQIVPGPDGETRFHSIRIIAEPGPDGRPTSVLAVGYDLTAQKTAEEELRLAASVFHNSMEGVLVTDAAGVIVSVNPAFTEITGYAEAEALGRRPSLLRSDHQGPEFYREMWTALNRDGHWRGEIWNRKKSGEAYLEWLTINRIDDGEGVAVRYVAVFHDITEMRRKDEHIRHMAFHDALTGLPNRALMQDRLQHALERAQREGGRLALTFIDLDRFKDVNDSLGHNIGDLLLQEVARRIKGRLRTSDTVARLGGDEFVVLMEDLTEAGHFASVAQELIADIARPMQLLGHTVDISASMGMAFFPEDGSDPLDLMKCADTAMYAAKVAGRNTYRFFQQGMLDDTNQ
jgi:diguanylate cyclase (GGDEF)-like protein/PAS domain S-box-containing protein